MTDRGIRPMPEWFDSHCHLQDEFLSRDGDPVGPGSVELDGAVVRAAGAGVTRLVCVGTGAASSREAIALATAVQDPASTAGRLGVRMWATVGLHPHDATDGIDEVAELLAASVGDGSPVVAVGECGLDYHYDHSPRSVQREVFAAQVVSYLCAKSKAAALLDDDAEEAFKRLNRCWGGPVRAMSIVPGALPGKPVPPS